MTHRQSHSDLHCPCHLHQLMRMLPMGMGVDAGAPLPDGPAPSFTDGTRQSLSPFIFADDSHTRDLFEVAAPGQPLLIRGATVIPIGSPHALPDHDVLLVNGVIADVMPGGGAAPDNALIVDGTGGYLIPGLSDMHSHPTIVPTAAMWAPLMGEGVTPEQLALPYDLLMFLYLGAGITRTQVMAGTPEYLALRDAVKARRFRGPAMRVASPVVDGYPPIWAPDISWLVGDEDGARHAARLIVERGYDYAKPYTKLDARAYHALAAECRALGVEMTGHIPKAIRAEEALALGQRGVAHTFELFANPDDPERHSLDAFARRARMCANLDVTVESTLLVAFTFEYDVGLRPEGCDPEAFLDPVMRFLMNERSMFIQSWRSNPEMVEQGRDNVKHSVAMAQALVAENVRYVTGTDIPNPNGVARQSLHEEFEILARDVGMAPIDILKASTLHSAEHMGEAACAGTIAKGMRGDLVLLERDPTVDIRATRDIRAVIVGDAILRRDAIDTGFARAKALYDAMPVPGYPLPA